jgi:glycosyl hydrolase family 65
MADPETAAEAKRATSRRLLGDDRPLAPTSDRGWLLVVEGFTSIREHEIESIFAVANGYVGARASLEEGSRVSQPATFVAGIYVDDPASTLGPALAVLPDWAHLQITADGDRVSIESGRVLEHRRVLDLRQGALWREWRQQDVRGRITRVRFLRLASLADRHVLTAPDRAAVFEDALVGVEAGRAGRFRLVVGIGGGDHAADLRAHGADIVVADLRQLALEYQAHGHDRAR